jgi:hypothetical protein
MPLHHELWQAYLARRRHVDLDLFGLGEVHQFHAKLLQLVVAADLEGLPRGLAQAIGFDDVDLGGALQEQLAQGVANARIGVRHLPLLRHGGAKVGLDHHG